MQPSEEAIAEAEKIFYEGFKHDADDPKLTRMLSAAYAIDVAPLEAELKRYQSLHDLELKRAQKAEGEHWDANLELVKVTAESDQLRAELDQKDKRLRELLREIAEHAHDWKTLRQHMECDGSDLPQLMKAWDELAKQLADALQKIRDLTATPQSGPVAPSDRE